MVGDEAGTAGLVNRLPRAQGQVASVISMIAADRESQNVVTQLAAVSRALNRAGLKIAAISLRGCVTGPAADGGQPINEVQLDKLFLALA